MTETIGLIQQIKAPKSEVFRRLLVKRRDSTTGLFESTWQDLSDYVIRWGSYAWSVDVPRFGDLRFDNNTIVVSNHDGAFNPSDNASSHWYGYGDLQRSLVKIEAGFRYSTLPASGIWSVSEYPTTTTLWTGIISGDIPLDGNIQVNLPLKPITQVFRDYPANLISGFTSTGISSGGFIAMLRDLTDGSSNFVFRPFLENTTSNWSIETGSSIIYANLNTSSAEDLHQYSAWDVIEKLGNCENKLGYVNQSGQFIWQSKTIGASEVFQFHGLGLVNRTYGTTIKRINRYGKRLTSFFSRVAVKYVNTDTWTSFVNVSLPFAVSGSNTAWNLGNRTYRIDNFWLPDSAAAAVVANAVFDRVSSQKEEIEFTTSFVPHIQLYDNISVSHDSSSYVGNRYYWDINNWAEDTTISSNELYWDPEAGDAILLDSITFAIISVNVDLDNLQSRFVGIQS